MNRASLFKRVEALEESLVVPPSMAKDVLRWMTDEQLAELERRMDEGTTQELWDALVASYRPGESAVERRVGSPAVSPPR